MSAPNTPHDPFDVPMPPTNVMLGRPRPALASPNDLLRNISPPAAPYPTAGSVMGTAMGRNPYLVSRNLLMSGQPSSVAAPASGFALEASGSGGGAPASSSSGGVALA